MKAGRAVGWLIAVSGAVRLAWAGWIGPGNDEAYYSLFATHLDWAYFDHPPAVGWVVAAGLALAGPGPSVLGLRLGFVAMFAGSTWAMYRLGARLYGERAGAFAALALNLSAYHTAAVGAFALPDGPLLFFWLLTLDRLVAALQAPKARIVPWVWVGLAWGGAMLSKYHAIFLPLGFALYLAVEPSTRRWIGKPGPYLAAAIGWLVFAPVIVWNARNGWASFAFQGERALGGTGFRPDSLAIALFGPALYLTPWIFAGLVAAGLGRAPGGGPRWAARFSECAAVVPLLAFGLVACTRPVLPHWSLVGFVPLFPRLGAAWAARVEANPARMARRLRGMAAVVVAVAAAIGLQANRGALGPVDPRSDPTVDLFGWDQVAEELGRRGLLRPGGAFLFTGAWYHSGQLAFATRGGPVPVLCYNAGDARGFARWTRPEDWSGRDGILVAVDRRSIEPGIYERWFARIEPIGGFDVVRAGVTVRTIRLFRCSQPTKPPPFAPERT